MRPYRSTALGVAGLLLLETSFGAVIPLSLRYIIDVALVSRDRHALLLTVGLLAVSGIIITAAGFLRDYLVTRLQSNVLGDLRARMFEHLQKLSLNYYSRTQAGEILSRFSTDLASVEHAMSTMVAWGILPALDCLVSTGLLLALDWRLAAIALIVWPWCLLVPNSLVPRVSDASYLRKARDSEILTAVQENIFAQPVIKAFSLERPSIIGFIKHNTNLLLSSIRVGFLTAALERSAEAAIVVLQVITMGVGALLAFNGSLTIGTLASFQSLFLVLSYSLFYATQYLGNLPPASAGFARIDELLREASEIADAPGVVSAPRFSRAIEFREMSFGYSESQLNLVNVSLSIPAGTSAAVVGQSGSGKSTMLSLLMRFYDPLRGRISIDGVNLKDVSLQSLRSQMGVVFQESFLFNISLKENIRLGRPGATDLEVEAAARAAEIHDFIVSLPLGYDTVAGERGGRLSGGQRQRVAIARVLVRNPAILLLDEATSALDPATESALNATIKRISAGRTLISVTHRLAAAAEADRIFVLEAGSLVESGRHEELLASEGAYAQMWKKQAGFKLHEDGARVEVDIRRFRDLPILASLSDPLLVDLSEHFSTEQFPAGRVIVHEGDPGSRFYILVRGKAAVLKAVDSEGQQRQLGVLQDGDFFGEIALLKDSPRTATVQAIQPCLCVSLARQSFDSLLKKHPDVRSRVTEIAMSRYAQQGQTW